jgi:acyl-CoA thioesterase II
MNELPMPATAADLVSLFDLETVAPDEFRGHSLNNGWKRVFGGQVLAQSLVAASRTVEGRAPHSLHAYFLLAGDPLSPILFEVERIRDGRSFTTRRVVAKQRDAAIFVLSVSFQIHEEGLEHSFPMPATLPPEKLIDPEQLTALAGARSGDQLRAFFDRIKPIELRPVDLSRYVPSPGSPAREPRQSLWIRIDGRLPDDPAIHRAALLYLSDMTLLDTALVAHHTTIFSGDIQGASLDHALWFHRPCRADEWLLYVQDSPNAGGARGLTRGLLYSRAGELVASVAQEGLMRLRRKEVSAD